MPYLVTSCAVILAIYHDRNENTGTLHGMMQGNSD